VPIRRALRKLGGSRVTGAAEPGPEPVAPAEPGPAAAEPQAAGAAAPPPGQLDLGSLRRLSPVSDIYGLDRGNPIDRYYGEAFLDRHAADVRGRVLEINDDRYSKRYGGDRVTKLDIVHPDDSNPQATIVADLADAPQIPDDSFDCMICTQTIMYIYDVHAAVRTMNRILAPGGVVFVTVPGVSRICQPEDQIWGDFWRFTTKSITRIFEDAFGKNGAGNVTVATYGNVLTAAAQLYGIAAEELTGEELDHRDPNFEVLLAVRAQKAQAPAT
jgi:SAM-dependent methyltransferase